MKTIRQLLRQPMKTIMGILLSALAAAVLCVCVGQNISSGQIKARLDEMFSTQAVPFVYYTKEADEWALQYAKDHPEVVKSVASTGLISGYLPELKPDSYTSYLGLQKNLNQNYKYSTSPEYVTEYGDAILEFRLDVIGDTTEDYQILRGTILQVVEMNETHTDPTGYNVQIHWYGEDVELQIGERYLLYTDSYTDLDWKLRSEQTQMADTFSAVIPPLPADKLSPVEGYNLRTIDFCSAEGPQSLSTEIVAKLTTFCDGFREQDGELVSLRYPVFLEFSERDLYSFRTVFCTVGDDAAGLDPERYSRPGLVRLEGTASEFLGSPAGEVWQEALQEMEVNLRAYPFLGIETLNDIPTFAGNGATMAQGRSFTEAELSQGAKVCMISAELAELNDLKVGDVLRPQFYERDPNLGAGITEGYEVLNPQPTPYNAETCELNEQVSYTIVGIYQQNAVRESVDRNLYGFTPNTIFVPKASVSAQMDYSFMGLFRTFHLVNGTMEEFNQAAKAAGFSTAFKLDDHNYAEMESTMLAYITNTQKMLSIGLAAYLILLVLLVVLYPAQQGKIMRTMDSLGAERSLRFRHMMVSNLGVFLPGTALGIWTAAYLWDFIGASLMDGNEAVLAVEVNVVMLLVIGLLHLLGLAGILAICAWVLTKPQSLMNSRNQSGDPKVKKSAPTLAVLTLGAVLSLSLCGLHLMSEAEQENYENMSLTLPVYVTVTDLTGAQDDNLQMEQWVWDVFTKDEMMGQFFEEDEIFYKLALPSTYRITVDGRVTDCDKLSGIKDLSADTNLVQAGDEAITWLEGYGDWVLLGSENLCVIPAEYLPADREGPVKVIVTVRHNSPEIVENQYGVKMQYPGYIYEAYEFYVAGVHHSGAPAVYCPAEVLWNKYDYLVAEWREARSTIRINYAKSAAAIQKNETDYTHEDMLESIKADTELLGIMDPTGKWMPWPEEWDLSYIRNMEEALEMAKALEPYSLRDRICGVLADNSMLDSLWKEAKNYFVKPDPAGKLVQWKENLSGVGYYPYALRIEDEQYRAAQAALTSSMAISIGCTIAIFGLSIAASFLIAFLMIRAKSHEIMLMRTLGAPPTRICLDALREQLISFLIGVGLGGLFFLWQPQIQLITLCGIFFAGLCIALTVFLNNNLMTIQKEDE